jgi:chromosome segregation ATPase
MSDIVEDLRLLQSGAQWACGQTAATLEQAADEIERLRAELDEAQAEANAGRQAEHDADVERRAVESERDRLREALRAALLAHDIVEAEHPSPNRPVWVEPARAALSEIS